MLRLITIPISHYCEKARWALERAGLSYREQRHVQGVHRLAARRAGGGRTVPVLVTPERVIGESEQIVAWADEVLPVEQRLLPGCGSERDEVLGICRRFDAELGPRGRRLMYVHMLAQRRLALRFNNNGVPRFEDAALRWGWPLLRRYVSRELGIVPGVQEGDEAAVFRELDCAAELLSDGRPFLCGERFGAADLTFAAMAAAVLMPSGYGVPLPQPDMLAPATAALVARARAHPAGRHALMLFAAHRDGSPQPEPARG